MGACVYCIKIRRGLVGKKNIGQWDTVKDTLDLHGKKRKKKKNTQSPLSLNLSIHQIRTQRQLDPSRDIGARMEEASLLKKQHATSFWHNVKAALHIISMKRRGTAFERAFGRVGVRFIQVEVKRVERTLLHVRRDIHAVSVG